MADRFAEVCSRLIVFLFAYREYNSELKFEQMADLWIAQLQRLFRWPIRESLDWRPGCDVYVRSTLLGAADEIWEAKDLRYFMCEQES